uniref:Pre-mRNA 3'-end-processing factor FIP1 n=1 Tax=Scleropages formosus TaxID=113540 RepID=A0A8C9S0H3_SCLFO
MSAEEAERTTTDVSAGDDEEEWLYGGEGYDDHDAALAAPPPRSPTNSECALAPPPEEEEAAGNGVASQQPAAEEEDSNSDSDDDDDDDVRVTIGDIKTGAPQYGAYGAAPVNLNIKTSGRPYVPAGTKPKGIDLDAPGSINGIPVLEVDMESFEEKPWRKPGADLSDYFNYGFNEDTWKAYCEKQKRLRMGLDVMTLASATSKIMVQQGRTGNSERESALSTPKVDFASPGSVYKAAAPTTRISPPQWPGGPMQDSSSSSFYTKNSGTIDVIGGQTATISRVEGRRRHNVDGNNIQVISEHPSSDAEPTPAKMPPFFPPGPIPPNIPPPPFLPPPPNVSSAPPLIPPPRGFPPLASAVSTWPGVVDSAKQWDYYSRRDKERERDKERDRPRERVHESLLSLSVRACACSDEERYRYREYSERGYERHRDRSSREKEERHRERRHRDKEEGRHKSSRSSSRRRHDSEEGDAHRRHKHKKSKRSKEGKEASEENSAEQENQDGGAAE